MEPVVVKEIKNGKIMLTEDELKEIVRRAYTDGYWEGKKSNWTVTTPYYYSTTSIPRHNDITITCDKQNIDGQLNLDLGEYINNLVGDFMND